MPTSTTIGALAALSIALYTLRQTSLRKRSIANEKILIVGASSGVGLELAKEHAARSDVSLHLVARRPLDALCKSLSTGSTASVRNSQVDVSVPTEVCRLVDEIGQAWSRIDTVIVCAGALTVQPVLVVTGQAQSGSPTSISDVAPSADRLEALSSLAQQSYKANVMPTLLLVTALLPMLLKSDKPRIASLSSVAAEIPAPTRAIYAANKAAASMSLRCLRIELESLAVHASDERKSIGVTIIHPASIDTGLRSSALDADVRSSQSSERKAMSPRYVAQRIIEGLRSQEDEIWLPGSYWWISKIAMLVLPNVVKRGAKRKYGFV